MIKKILFSFLFSLVTIFGFSTEVTISKTVYDLFPDDADGTKEVVLYSDSVISISVNSNGNNGKVYESGTEWRLYQSNNAVITVTAEKATIDTICFTFNYKNGGTLNYQGTQVKTGKAVVIESANAEFSVGNSGTATNGQIKIKAFRIVYEKEETVPTANINVFEKKASSKVLKNGQLYIQQGDKTYNVLGVRVN